MEKGKDVPVHAKKAMMKQVLSFVLQPFNPSKVAHGTHNTGGRLGHGVGLDALEKRKFLVPAQNQTTIPVTRSVLGTIQSKGSAEE
jgi:hypothetical protein